MCGIAGVVQFQSQPASRDLLQRMGLRIAHRGPDDEGIYADGPCGLAHRRLSILDLSSAAHQPMASPDGTSVLCYNGEIYNFRDLREQLSREGVQFHSTGDTEVLLHACRQWGVRETVRRANGMFAFGYWDARRQELWLARDRCGIKPLYFHRDSNRLIFASEIKALLGELPTRPNPIAVLSLLSAIPVHDPHTPFEGIQAIEGGQLLRVTPDGSCEASTYFSLAEAVNPDLYREFDRLGEQDVIDLFDGLMQRSVELHLASDAAVAAMASGGLDSSIVAHLTRQHMPTVSAYHADVVGELSESRFARMLAEHSSMPLRLAELKPELFVQSIAEVTYANECPLNLHPNTIPFFLVCRLAANDGIKVLLTGEGADELFAGYPAFRANRMRRQFEKWRDRLLRPLKWLGLGKVGRALVRYSTSDEARGLRSNRTGLMTLGRALQVSEEGQQAYSFIGDPIERESQVDLYCYLHGYLQSILWRNDRMGMAVGLESRVPFLENELIRNAMSLPMRFKLRRGENKWVLRKLSSRHLPPVLSGRPKFGFPVDSAMYPNPGAKFFENGFLAEHLAVGTDSLNTLRNSLPGVSFQWLLVEIWGQMYFLNRSPAEITDRLVTGGATAN